MRTPKPKSSTTEIPPQKKGYIHLQTGEFARVTFAFPKITGSELQLLQPVHGRFLVVSFQQTKWWVSEPINSMGKNRHGPISHIFTPRHPGKRTLSLNLKIIPI